MLLSEQSVSLALEVHLQTLGAGQKGGLLSREALSEALACSSLITVLVQTMGDAALQPLEPTLRYDYSSAGTPLYVNAGVISGSIWEQGDFASTCTPRASSCDVSTAGGACL